MSDFSLASGGLLRGENDVELELENLSNVLKVGSAFFWLQIMTLSAFDALTSKNGWNSPMFRFVIFY